MSIPKGNDHVYGVPSLPRHKQPSMYQMLSWADDGNKSVKLQKEQKQEVKSSASPDVRQNNGECVEKVCCRSDYCQCQCAAKSLQKSQQKRKQHKNADVKYELYSKDQIKLKKSQSQVDCKTSEPKKALIRTESSRQIDLNQKEIEERKSRIKKFELVTRDLPNSAYITYYGKPAFEVYGRGTSVPNLKTHNVMPHKGSNNPAHPQTYNSALIKGKKLQISNHIPRKPIETKLGEDYNQKEVVVNIPMETPDLIHHIRFTKGEGHLSKNQKIPTNVAPKKKEDKMKAQKKAKSKKLELKAKLKKSKGASPVSDGLKFMNQRQNLIQILQDKKTNSTKLAYKVTECYPYNLKDEEELKQSVVKWQQKKAAGKPYPPSQNMTDIITFAKEAHS